LNEQIEERQKHMKEAEFMGMTAKELIHNKEVFAQMGFSHQQNVNTAQQSKKHLRSSSKLA
jgi:hypothetical protein